MEAMTNLANKTPQQCQQFVFAGGFRQFWDIHSFSTFLSYSISVVGILWPCYRGHLGSLGSKWQNESDSVATPPSRSILKILPQNSESCSENGLLTFYRSKIGVLRRVLLGPFGPATEGVWALQRVTQKLKMRT